MTKEICLVCIIHPYIRCTTCGWGMCHEHRLACRAANGDDHVDIYNIHIGCSASLNSILLDRNAK